MGGSQRVERADRPVIELARTKDMDSRALDLRVVGSFDDHEGLDGVMLGVHGGAVHFEFTHSRRHPVLPTPTVEDLVVLFIPPEREWKATCAAMVAAGFRQVTTFNPYWEATGRTDEGCDGFRIVLQQGEWKNTEKP
jgi:hypothetical protein